MRTALTNRTTQPLKQSNSFWTGSIKFSRISYLVSLFSSVFSLVENHQFPLKQQAACSPHCSKSINVNLKWSFYA
jgi:hypothetical protein